jgi:NAD(P)-dependent dehydrogenase (short-subunit alcohol dehydrogenase family)
MDIAGSAALVTGAASGLGAATAAALAARGATVYGLDLDKAVEQAGPAPDGVTLLPADVTREEPVQEALARIDADGAELRLAAAAMTRHEPDAGGQRGLIVNTASIAAFEGQIGQIAYAASKAGVAGMTVTAARDLAQYGIRVVTVAPGIVDTPMMAGFSEEVRAGLGASVPFPQRLARPEEYARLVTMIAEHDYLNGETIRMDGALRMSAR